jgi:hypothetical protein
VRQGAGADSATRVPEADEVGKGTKRLAQKNDIKMLQIIAKKNCKNIYICGYIDQYKLFTTYNLS